MRRAVFCDFDGTITVEDTFADMLRLFVPDLAPELLEDIYGLKVPMPQGIRQLVESIPSRRYEEVLEHIGRAEVREGLDELLDFLESEGVPFYVVSGGLTGMVKRVLGTRAGRVQGIYAPDVDLNGSFLHLTSDFESERGLLDKVKVMNLHPAEDRITIGNSLSDLYMSQDAELAFARDRLSTYLSDRNHPFKPWEDFHQVREVLQERWHTAEPVRRKEN